MRSSFGVVGMLAASFCLECPAAIVQYTVTDLGTLGGSGSYGYAINSNGQVAGYSAVTGDGATRAFRYDGSTMSDLGTLSGYSSSASTGINSSGQVAGFAHTLGSTGTQAFRTAPNAGINPASDGLGTLGGDSSYAKGINNSGQVVGASKITAGFGSPQHAFLYSGTTMTDLQTLGGTNSVAYAINDSGQVVGWSHIAGDSATHSFLYQNGTMTDLLLPGEVESEAYSINDLGEVAGTIRLGQANVWRGYVLSGSTLVNVGVLPGGISSFALGINDSGAAVGYVNTSGTDVAFLFANSMLADLNTLIDPLAGWTLNRAYGINDSGQIVGQGTIDGEMHAFLLTPLADAATVPEPAGIAVFALAFLPFFVRGECRPVLYSSTPYAAVERLPAVDPTNWTRLP